MLFDPETNGICENGEAKSEELVGAPPDPNPIIPLKVVNSPKAPLITTSAPLPKWAPSALEVVEDNVLHEKGGKSW